MVEGSEILGPGGPDQDKINCPVCGRVIAYDRWGHKPQRMTCSEACQNRLEEITGDRTSSKWLEKRAADPNICILCGAPLEDKVRGTKLYCSPRCQKRGVRRGINADRLMRIRKSAINGKTGQI